MRCGGINLIASAVAAAYPQTQIRENVCTLDVGQLVFRESRQNYMAVDGTSDNKCGNRIPTSSKHASN